MKSIHQVKEILQLKWAGCAALGGGALGGGGRSTEELTQEAERIQRRMLSKER